jgi:hypothetical protein
MAASPEPSRVTVIQVGADQRARSLHNLNLCVTCDGRAGCVGRGRGQYTHAPRGLRRRRGGHRHARAHAGGGQRAKSGPRPRRAGCGGRGGTHMRTSANELEHVPAPTRTVGRGRPWPRARLQAPWQSQPACCMLLTGHFRLSQSAAVAGVFMKFHRMCAAELCDSAAHGGTGGQNRRSGRAAATGRGTGSKRCGETAGSCDTTLHRAARVA